MKNNKFLSATRSELRALIITAGCICIAVLLPPFMSSVSKDQPMHEIAIIELPLPLDTLPIGQVESFTTEPFDINSAEVEDLVSLNGIGQTLGTRIIKFRDKLGGFYSIDQVGETYGLAPETFSEIRPYLLLETSHKVIRLTEVNEWQLAAHAYISRDQATALYQYLQKNGPPSNITDLEEIGNLTWLKKLEPYLAFGS